MKAQAVATGYPFMPSLAPTGPVDYVFVGQDPSLGRWARNHQDATALTAAGYRSIHPVALHFPIRKYLLKPGERYCITDIAKGAMYGKEANDDKEARTQRWERWWTLLEAELGLVAKPGARIVALGKAVEDYLRKHDCGAHPLVHYAALMEYATHRKRELAGHEEDFEQFKGSVSLADVIAVWQDVLDESVPTEFHDEERRRAANRWSDTLATIFIYKLRFETTGWWHAPQAAMLTTP